MNIQGKILAIDTATDYISVAFFSDSKIVAENTIFAPKRHSNILPELVDGILKISDEKISDETIIAISAGPGSYTGLRVGISFVQGLAASTDAKIVSIDTLKALAYCFAPRKTAVAVAIDARAGGIYACLYGVLGKPSPIIKTGIFELSELCYKLSSRGRILFVSDEIIYNEIVEGIHGTDVIYAGEPRPSAGIIAKLAVSKVNSGQFIEPENLEPKYLRQFKAGTRKRKPII
ncbi:tRNA (adenosine(37)-N6)-threonylcarbamoyltransferase complex dimerization subunit type 1 TsaB [bacterium]|nr:tRNA (adenosine(37)-N6)-threonylcarbamoyltransferase complex dimerization subunit type 1 TsaB [bacterium]